jgi:hypothetical protein
LWPAGRVALARGIARRCREARFEFADHPAVARREPAVRLQFEHDLQRRLVAHPRRGPFAGPPGDFRELDVGNDQVALPAGVAGIGLRQALGNGEVRAEAVERE